MAFEHFPNQSKSDSNIRAYKYVLYKTINKTINKTKHNKTKQNNIKSSNFTVFSLYDAYIGLSKECPIHKICNYNLDFEYLAFYTFLNAQFCLKMAQNYTKYIANSPDLYRSAKINHILGEFPYLWKRVNIKTMAKILFMTKGVSSEYKSATNIT